MEPRIDEQETDWIKLDLHIHTLDDPKDALDYSAHELLERARALGFRVLAITLHDAVFDRADVFADAANLGILLIPAAEVRLDSLLRDEQLGGDFLVGQSRRGQFSHALLGGSQTLTVATGAV